MLFALRDGAGNITALTDRAVSGATPISASHPDVLAFLSLDHTVLNASDFLDDSDLSTVRILEDLIDTLVNRQVIRFTDLPAAAQRKLLSRKVARTLACGEDEPKEDVRGTDDVLFLREDDQLF
ncbi:MAG: hypothetical protein ACPHXW_03485 [Marinobacterium sp.]